MNSALVGHPLWDAVQAEVEALLASLRAKLEDGLTVTEAFSLVRDFVTCVVNIVSALDGSTEDKRELAILIAQEAWTAYAVPAIDKAVEDQGVAVRWAWRVGRQVVEDYIDDVVGMIYDWLAGDRPMMKSLA